MRSEHRIKNWLENNIVGILTFIGPSIALAIKTFFLENDQWTKLEVVLLVLLILESCIVFVKFLWNKFSYKSYGYPRSRIVTNYNVIKKEINYSVNERDELLFSRKMVIKSNINHLESIFDKYIWTGSSTAKTPKTGENIRIIDEQSIIGIWRYFRIILTDHLAKGEEREISYKWPKIQQCTTSSPFVSISTDEPTKEVIFKLKLGAKYANREIRLEEFRAIESDNPISMEVAKLDQSGEYEWKVPHVKRFRYYRIRWSWVLTDSTVPELNLSEGEK